MSYYVSLLNYCWKRIKQTSKRVFGFFLMFSRPPSSISEILEYHFYEKRNESPEPSIPDGLQKLSDQFVDIIPIRLYIQIKWTIQIEILLIKVNK